MSKLQAVPEWLDARTMGRPVGVDRKQNALLGYVVAQLGPFKSEGRGEFDRESLEKIVSLGNAKRQGLRARFTHPGLSSDGLGSYLGRSKNLAIGTAIDERTGRMVDAVRADLLFDQTSLETPPNGGGKPLGIYVMDLAESDPEAISSSLVLKVDYRYRLNEDGTRKTDDDGEDLPPLWHPTELLASDVVDVGDAVDGLLSAGIDPNRMPDGLVRLATDGLNRLFAGAPREVVEARALAFLSRYLDGRYGPMNDLDLRRRRLELRRREL